jgi:hypothetical protein
VDPLWSESPRPVQALEWAIYQVQELGIESGAQADGAVGQLQRQTSLQGGHARQPTVGRAVGVRPLFYIFQDAEGGDARRGQLSMPPSGLDGTAHSRRGIRPAR